MDNAGWHAHRRAQKESEYYAAHGGRYEDIGPMPDGFIGGFYNNQPSRSHSPAPPPLPPKDGQTPRPNWPQTGYFPPPVDKIPSGQYNSSVPAHPIAGDQQFPYTQPQPAFPAQGQPVLSTDGLTHLNAIQRSQQLRVARMDPHLQFMCGPLLKFDTIDECTRIWYGAVLIVTADSGSFYEPHPKLTYEWDPDKLTPATIRSMRMDGNSTSYVSSPVSDTMNNNFGSYPNRQAAVSLDLGPHPADPHSTVLPGLSSISTSSSMYGDAGPNYRKEEAYVQEIYVYGGLGGTFTFWRFMIQIPLNENEMEITYRINNGQALNFFVPGRTQNMRWAAHSCNGFSAGVNPDDFRGPGFKTGYDPVWMDLLTKHSETPFHALVGGGDQLYCDSLVREPEMQDWVSKMKPEEKKQYPLTEEIKSCIDRFFFNHYCQSFRRGAFARANSSIPMVNMCDDHDLIDGFGSYPDDMQRAPVFRQIGARGYLFFLLFQCFINPEVDGTNDTPGNHVYRSMVFGQMGPYIPQVSHSFLINMGPHVALLALDSRTERKKDQICSPSQYEKVFQKIKKLPHTIEHLIVMVGVPIAYPRMVFLETALESKLNPLVALGRTGSLGLSGFVNKFNADAELLDDLNDHWTARLHKKERNWLIEQLQAMASHQRLRISILSGDVHCAAVGVLKSLTGKKEIDIPPGHDHRYMLNVVTSAIVNTPPPAGVLTLVNQLSTKTHRTLHHSETDESMYPLFGTDTDGSSRKQKYIMGRRNWCSVDWIPGSGDLQFTLQIEKEKGNGLTIPYPVTTPGPSWARSK